MNTKTLIWYLLKNMSKDVYTIIYSVCLPIALLVGLYMFFEDPGYRGQLLAGVLALNTMMGALNLTAFDVLQPRNRGVLKLVKATPVKLVSFMAAFASARLLFTFALNAAVLLVAAIGFGVHVSLLEALAMLVVLFAGSLPLLGLGFLCGNLAGHEGQVNMLTNLLCFPMIFTSESFYSMAHAPNWAIAIGKALPYKPFVEGLNSAMGGNFAALPQQLLLLAAFSLAAWVLAAVTFRWDSSEKAGGARFRRTGIQR